MLNMIHPARRGSICRKPLAMRAKGPTPSDGLAMPHQRLVNLLISNLPGHPGGLIRLARGSLSCSGLG